MKIPPLSDLFHCISRFCTNMFFWLCIISIGWMGARLFLYSSFKIPSDSMKPALIAGDIILVLKPVIGIRLINPFTSYPTDDRNIRRLPGFRKIRHNDVLVFNFPYLDRWDTLRINPDKYYVKRCVGLPGDTLEIRKGHYFLNGREATVGDTTAQNRLACQNRETFGENVFHTFPYHANYCWNIKDFGPLYIPAEGDSIQLTPANLCLYRKLIEWEQKAAIRIENNIIHIGNKPVIYYCFLKNYYFMAGDYAENSQDSRYWGLLPEPFIVGKASYIWKSLDPSGKYRWERTGKAIR